MLLTREELESIAAESPLIDEDGEYCLLQHVIVALSLAAVAVSAKPAVATQLNNATIDYLQQVDLIINQYELDEDLGQLRLLPIEDTQPKQVEVINVQQS